MLSFQKTKCKPKNVMAVHLGINRKTQKGAALLAWLMIFIVAASYSLVRKLNVNTSDHLRRGSSLSVLNEAKASLIGYAVNYPLDHAGEGPGYLPCPDRTDPTSGLSLIGSAGTSCSLAGGTTVGRIPWKTLELSELRDAAGEVLWYAVSDNYKNNPKTLTKLNSDSAGNFSVDGNNDVVAIIFAAGIPVGTQDRADDPLDVSNYLEDDNATNGDNSFVSKAAGEFNDSLVAITRQELMSAVEKRVLGDVNEALTDYQTTYNAFPWLSSFNNPSASSFRGAINTWQGHIPFHWAADPDSVEVGTGLNIIGRNPFTTNVAVSWDNITAADTSSVNNVYSTWGYNTMSAACLNDINDCDEGGIFPEITSLSPVANINCTWSDKNTAACDSFTVTTVGAYTPNASCPASTITRTYTINYPEFTGVSTEINPTTTATRRRNVSLTAAGADFIPAQNDAIGISDVVANLYIFFFGSCFGPFGSATVATGTSTFLANTQGTIAVDDIQYDLDIDNDELPSWFVENGWQDLIYIAYASGEPLPGDTTVGQDCVTLGTTCITANINGTANNNIRALSVSSGVDLNAARPSATITDYYEGENSNPVDDTFVKDKITTIYNDQTRIISTAP